MAGWQNTRETKWPCTVATRVDEPTRAAIDAAADERGELPSTILRELIELGLGRIAVERPSKRQRTPVRDAVEMASALALLRTMPGNLHRLYIAHAASGISDSELLACKAAIQEVCARLRTALGDGTAYP